MNQASASTIKVNIPQGILINSTNEANRIGISLQDFIRMLLATYFSRSESITSITRNSLLLKRAQREIKKGKFTEVKSAQELGAYLESI